MKNEIVKSDTSMKWCSEIENYTLDLEENLFLKESVFYNCAKVQHGRKKSLFCFQFTSMKDEPQR